MTGPNDPPRHEQREAKLLYRQTLAKRDLDTLFGRSLNGYDWCAQVVSDGEKQPRD